MENSKAPRGLIVDLVTPIKNGILDGKGLEKLLTRVLPHAQGLLLGSPRHGEGEAMERELRLELMKETFDALKDRPIPLFLWVSGSTEARTMENLLALRDHFEDRGRKGELFWVDTPLNYHSNRGLPDYYRGLLTRVKIPLVLHNDPEAVHTTRTFKRRNIRTAILKELVQIEGIAGLIFSGSLERAHHYQRACRGQKNFRLYDGDERRFLEHPSMGGVVSVGANLAPEAWGKVTRSSIQLHAHRENYPDRLQQIWESGDYLKRMVSLYGQDPAPIIKAMLAQTGTIEGPDMLRSAEINHEGMEALKRLMEDFGDCP